MPFRRTFRRRGTRGRRRTRWYSLGATAYLANADNQFGTLQLNVKDDLGVNHTLGGLLAGGTLLRVILDVVVEPVFGDEATYEQVWNYHHTGIFVEAVTAPSQTLWDPNNPSGDFMMRLSTYYRAWRSPTLGSLMTVSTVAPDGTKVYAGHVQHYDTNVKRRLTENDSLWLTWHNFRANFTDTEVGVIGRVLVALP